ncbi:MAG TPA: transposase [bacterium]|nr:transposase [bacterium]
MPRINRFDYLANDMLLHVRIQINNGEFRFFEERHFELFNRICRMYLKKYPTIKLTDYEWMSNHAHLIFHIDIYTDLPKFMHDFCWRFAFEYNKMQNRKGHLFQQRYRASNVNTDQYALSCQRYVYRNQLRAGMVKELQDTKWSSYHYYAYGQPNGLITPIFTYEQFGNTPEKQQIEFRFFVEKMPEHEETLWRAKLLHPLLKTKKEIVLNYLKKCHV